VTDRRAPTSDEVRDWQQRSHSDVKTLGTRVEDVRRELREEIATLREENAKLRDRVTSLETKEQAFHAWHRPAWDELRGDVKTNTQRIDRLILAAVAAGAGTGGGVAAILRWLVPS
jgi:regulator of replication initiation timing